jgi:hypothetical protein
MCCGGLQRLANPAFLEGISFLRFAARCTVLRSRWYQSGISPLRIGYPLVLHILNTWWPRKRSPLSWWLVPQTSRTSVR